MIDVAKRQAMRDFGLTEAEWRDTERTIHRALSARGLRPAPTVNWCERLIERTGRAERWEYLDFYGYWRKFWRRNGEVPDEAIPNG